MRCQDCGVELQASKRNHRYLESGLDNVVLASVDVEQCAECGMVYVSIPRQAQLHRAIATHLAQKQGRLLPAEIRFLRKSLGLSGADFADFMHVSPSTVSRWESKDKPQDMGTPSEIALRLAVLLGLKIENYELAQISKLSLDPVPSERLVMSQVEAGWHGAVAA